MHELVRRSASELAELVRSGTVSSREVISAHLERINEINGTINAVTVVLAETALEAADLADQALADKAEVGPLHGIPFTIKENIDCVGTATTQGIPMLAQALPPADAPVVARMKAAGAIPIGRTNMPEMGLRLSTDNPLRGRTVNPWHPTLTAGGSSGGDAAALATGMTPFGLGNDIGGSLRNPAYCCGITSLKPTAGRIPHVMSLPPQDAGMAVQAMLVEGPMTRSVSDLQLGLRLLAGRDIRDPVSVDAALSGPPPAHKRVALVTELPGNPLPETTIAAITQAGEVLKDAGYQIEQITPPELERVHHLWGEVFAIDFEELMPLLAPAITPALSESLSTLIADFKPSISNAAVHTERARLTRLWSNFFSNYPVVVGPIWSCLPWPFDADLDPETGADLLNDTMRFITPGNVLGLPSVAMPVGTADGLPTGVQIYGDLWREDLCLEAAAVIESAVGAPVPINPAF